MAPLLLSDEIVAQPKFHPKDLLTSRIAQNPLKAKPGEGVGGKLVSREFIGQVGS